MPFLTHFWRSHSWDCGPLWRCLHRLQPVDLRSLRRQHRQRRRGTRPAPTESPWQGRHDRSDPAIASSGRAIDRAVDGRDHGPICPRRTDGPPRGNPQAETPGRDGGDPDARKNLDRHPTASSPPTWPREPDHSTRGTAEERAFGTWREPIARAVHGECNYRS